jgi:plasmid stabilization system protein ParE
MRYTVTWHPFAEQELAEIWLAAGDRADVTKAANRIDEFLGSEPLTNGEDFYGDRILVALPLAVTYTVREPDRSVQILQVWHQ